MCREVEMAELARKRMQIFARHLARSLKIGCKLMPGCDWTVSPPTLTASSPGRPPRMEGVLPFGAEVWKDDIVTGGRRPGVR